MLSKETEQCISRLLSNIANNERSIEITRQVLAQDKDFDPYQTFKILDMQGKSNIDAINLVEFLKKNGVYSTTTEMHLIILFVDENSDGLLSYTEFLNFVLSDSNNTLRRLARERAGKAYNNPTMTYNVEYSLVKLLEKELALARSIQSIFDELRRKEDYNPHDYYHLLKGTAFITMESLKAFFDTMKANYCNEDLKSIIKRLDLNSDGRVGFEEFHCFITFPQCSQCCCYHHHCCCKMPMSHIVNENNTVNQSFTQQSIQIPEKDNNIPSIGIDNNIKRVSPNLSLRSSPIRHYSPKRTDYSSPHHSFNNQTRVISHSTLFSNNNVCYEKGEQMFVNYLKDMMFLEYQIEKAKIDLVLRSDFNVEDAFRIFESQGRGFITEDELKYGLCQLKIFPSNTEIILLMKRLDIRKQGFIAYEDFIDMVTPLEKQYRLMIENRLPSSCSNCLENKSNVFLFATTIYLQCLIRLIIKTENQLENIKQSLKEITGPLLNSIYLDISKNNCFFNQSDFSYYLKKKGVISTDQIIFLGFIRLDKNRNGKIEYWELEEELEALL